MVFVPINKTFYSKKLIILNTVQGQRNLHAAALVSSRYLSNRFGSGWNNSV